MENGALRIDGQTYTTGLGMNAQCTLIYDLPKGHSYTTFRALCGYDSSCDTDNTSTSGTTMEFILYTTMSQTYDFDITQLGYAEDEAVPLHDIWTGENLGTATGILSTTVPSHGVRLFRLGNNVYDGIESIERGKENTQTIKGKWSNGKCYDLNGRRLTEPKRGLYVRDGRTHLKH